ncbi:hypothetical protein GCM10023063_49530 [Arthrobacter methylotrophus]|uniref:hypothetical protein n=1 Tax=Arthrobacter methylotrophus TaxID=121291 RepID=UPI0031E5AE1D
MAALALTLSCAGSNDDSTSDASSSQASQLPQLSPATGLNLAAACESFAGKLSFANTSITAISTVAAGTLSVGGNAVPEHCLVTGTMNTRVSPVDGKTYAIGFEMRLPRHGTVASNTRPTAGWMARWPRRSARSAVARSAVRWLRICRHQFGCRAQR